MPYQYVGEPLTAEEADRLANACETPTEQLIVWTLVDTGLRVSELCALTTKDVHWQQRQLRVRGKGGPYGKKSKVRVVPMSRRVRTLLEHHPHGPSQSTQAAGPAGPAIDQSGAATGPRPAAVSHTGRLPPPGLEETTDEVIDLFERCLARASARAERKLEEFRLATYDHVNPYGRYQFPVD